MMTDNLLDLRLELIRTNRMIRDELARARPDLMRVVDLRRHENACVDRLGKAIARLRSRRGPSAGPR